MLNPIQMTMIAFTAFIIVSDYSLALSTEKQAIFVEMFTSWNGVRQFPYEHFHNRAIAFSKLKALLRKVAARTIDELRSVIADCLRAFSRRVPTLFRGRRI
jgi:hypothetical protein